MKRTTRMGVGLVALIPVLGIVGGLLVAADVETITTAWIVLGVGVVWIALMIWWARRAPAARSAEAGARYWAPLSHARYRPPGRGDDAGPGRA